MSPLLVIFAALFGACAAALLPTLAHRLAVRYGEPARADCAGCGRVYPAWVRVGAACRCRPGSLVIVPIGAAATALPAAAIGPSPLLPVYLASAVPGLLLAVIDLRCRRLPDRLVGILAIVGAVPSAILRPSMIGPALASAVVVVTAYAILAGRGGLGLGDVKLAGVLALILGFAGWPSVIICVVAAHLINGPIAVIALLRGRRGPVAFGPALLAGALIAVTAT